jgi:pimeloyl-ACP methyl ester carboxylesterase
MVRPWNSGTRAPVGGPRTTLAWAEHDRLVTRPDPSRIPSAVRQVVLGGCGHIPTWDDPEHVARVILEGSSPWWGPDPGSRDRG